MALNILRLHTSVGNFYPNNSPHFPLLQFPSHHLGSVNFCYCVWSFSLIQLSKLRCDNSLTIFANGLFELPCWYLVSVAGIGSKYMASFRNYLQSSWAWSWRKQSTRESSYKKCTWTHIWCITDVWKFSNSAENASSLITSATGAY